MSHSNQSSPIASWIWNPSVDSQATNAFTYFEKTFWVETPHSRAAVLFAADANAQLFVNGVVLRRKVTRYTPSHLRPEHVLVGPHLRSGENTITVLHHNWGHIKTFQRTKTRRGGLWMRPATPDTPTELSTDTSWLTAVAPEYTSHTQQIIGVTGDLRVRFPVIIDGFKRQNESLSWINSCLVDDPVWTIVVDGPLTPQREYRFAAQRLLAAGRVDYGSSHSSRLDDLRTDINFPRQMDAAAHQLDEDLTRRAMCLPTGEQFLLRGKAGETYFFSFDFHQPVHGFPTLICESTTAGIALSLGYGELAVSHYDGIDQVDPATGKIRTNQVVGEFYGDRYLTAGLGRCESVEFPDERTARYLALHVTFPSDGPAHQEIALGLPAMIWSQYAATWKGSFECGHPRISQIVALCRIHAEVTMSDAYVDTPGREDGQWIEDIQLRARISETWCSDGELRRRTLLHSEETRIDGRFLSFTPQSFNEMTYWDWGMQWITILYEEWLWSNDFEFLRARYAALERYVSLLIEQINSDGLFCNEFVFADIRVGEHPVNGTEVSVIAHTWLIERLRQAGVLARILDRAKTATSWDKIRDAMTRAFHLNLVLHDEQGQPYAADLYRTETGSALGRSQASQISAIEAGLFDAEIARGILNTFFPKPFGKAPSGIEPWNNPTYAQKALKVLSDHGLGERAVAHLLWRYDPYLPASATSYVPSSLQGPLGGPLPEYFVTNAEQAKKPGSVSTGQPIDPTGSHGWAAVPLVWFHQTLLGVTWSLEKKELSIEPKCHGLPYVMGHVCTPFGTLFVHLEHSTYRMEIELPVDVKTIITLPDDKGWQVFSAPLGATSAIYGNAIQIMKQGRYLFSL